MILRRLTALGLSLGLAAVLLTLLFQSVRAAPASAIRFVAKNGSGSACTQAAPCLLAFALSDAGPSDTIYVKQGTYTNSGSSVIVVSLSITLFGGWSGNASGSPQIDPTAFPTIIDGQGSRRGVLVNSGITPTIDGFVVQNGNASGLFSGCLGFSAAGCGGGLFVDHSAAQILNNVFVSDTALMTTSIFAKGIGGGLYLEAANGSVISGNVFLNNSAVLPAGKNNAEGGGLAAEGNSPNSILIENNRFTGNSAYWGGGVAFDSLRFGQVQNNQFQSNTAALGGGLYIWESTAGASGNTFRGNSGDAPAYLGYFNGPFGGNLLVDNPTPAGLLVFNGGPTEKVLAYNNIIAHSGSAGIEAHSFISFPLTLYALNNTVVGPGTGAALVLADGDLTLTAYNNLLSGFSTGAVVSYPATSTVDLYNTLFDTGMTAVGNASYSNTVFGAAEFADPAQRNYHLLYNSAARDAGAPTLDTTDFDGDPRPLGGAFDIGADETRFNHGVFLPAARR